MATRARKLLMIMIAMIPVIAAIAIILTTFFDVRQLADKARMWALSELGGQLAKTAQAPPEVDQDTSQRVESAYKSLSQDLAPQLETKEVAIERGDNTLKIRFLEKVLFRSGSADITPQGQAILTKTAQALRNFDTQYFAIVGHTDNVPIKTDKFPSNWELSATRSCSVVHFLSEKSGLNPERFYAMGQGEYEPSFSNDTEEGKAGNRRVDIIVSDMNCLRDLKSPQPEQ
jgi:chemotaxis protein MotB